MLKNELFSVFFFFVSVKLWQNKEVLLTPFTALIAQYVDVVCDLNMYERVYIFNKNA